MELTFLSKNHPFLFENNDNPDIMFIYQLLTNDMLQILDTKKLNLIRKTLLYLSNGLIIYENEGINGNIQFICITKIIEKYI